MDIGGSQELIDTLKFKHNRIYVYIDWMNVEVGFAIINTGADKAKTVVWEPTENSTINRYKPKSFIRTDSFEPTQENEEFAADLAKGTKKFGDEESGVWTLLENRALVKKVFSWWNA
jgi:hypothetical protein